MSESSGPSFASHKCTGGDKTEFIECKASTVIPSKSTLADNDEKVSEDSSTADAAVCKHEQDLGTMKRSNWNGPRKLSASSGTKNLKTGIDSSQLTTTLTWMT